MAEAKIVLAAGAGGCGKTTLLRHFAEGVFLPQVPKTVGLEEEAGRVHCAEGDPALSVALRALLPPSGLHLHFWEIGGKPTQQRGAPRGRPVDGLLLCYDVTSRNSFQTAAHILLQHRMDRHQEHGSSAVARQRAGGAAHAEPAPLAAVLVGLKADEEQQLIEIEGGVSRQEATDFAKKNALRGSYLTSARTGEGVAEALQALAVALLEAEEEAEAELQASALAVPAPAGELWALASPAGTMSDPRGLRVHEPQRGAPAPDDLVELLVLDQAVGSSYGARPLATVLDRGLLHRAVHVWLSDARTGGLLFRRYAGSAPKHPGRWGPSGHGEVRCYPPGPGHVSRQHASEPTVRAAVRTLQEQIGMQLPEAAFEHWFSCASREGSCNELIEVFTAAVGNQGLPQLRLLPEEEVEWVHFTDIFGSEAASAGTVFHIEPLYRSSMITRMRARILHADAHEGAHPPTGLALGRPTAPLPISISHGTRLG